jgi:hypothetical protein
MDQKELFERLEELELEDFEVKEAKTSIPKSSFETVSAFSNTNGWKAYYENEPVSLNVVDFYKIASPLVKITKASEKTMEKVGEKGVLWSAPLPNPWLTPTSLLKIRKRFFRLHPFHNRLHINLHPRKISLPVPLHHPKTPASHRNSYSQAWNPQ